MKQRDDYEFKAMLSDLSIVERGLTLAEVVRRWLRRPSSRQWKLDDFSGVFWLVGYGDDAQVTVLTGFN